MKRIEGASKNGVVYNFYIDDKEKLFELISDDIWAESYPDIAIIEMFKANFSDFEIWQKKFKITGTGLFQTDKLRSYFIFTDNMLNKEYKTHLASQSKIIELKLHVFVKVIANSNGSIFIDIQRFIKDNNNPNNIEFKTLENNIVEIILCTSQVDNKTNFISSSLEKVKKIIDCYSYLQKIGIQIITSNLENIPRKGISYFIGNPVRMYHGVKFSEIEKLLGNYKYLEFILNQYNRSLCEINPRSKLLMLWSLIEDIFFKDKIDFIKQEFDNDPLLDNKDKRELKKILKGSNLSTNKIKKIIQRACEIKGKDRNTIIAENISKILSEDYNQISEKIKFTSRIRGHQAHSTKLSSEKVSTSILFLQHVVEKLIGKIINEYF